MLKKKIFINTSYGIISQIFNFVFGIMLARILLPKDFGIYGISFLIVEATSFLTLRMFSVALVQINEDREEYFSSVFWLNLLISFILSIVIFLCAPIAERFFNMPSLGILLRWQVIALVIMSFEVIPVAKLLRELKFKELGVAELVAAFITGIFSVLFVILGLGALSLVFGYLIGYLFKVLIYNWNANQVKAEKNTHFSFGALRKLSHVGVGVMIQQLFAYISSNVDYFLLGKLTNATVLGFYTRAFKIMRVPVSQISWNIGRVLLPAFSRIQDDNEDIARKLFKATQATSIIIFPVFLILYFYSPAIIYFIYGVKWVPVAGPFRILAFAGMITSVSCYLGEVLKAKGIVYRELFVQILSTIILALTGIFATKYWGMIGMSYAVVFSAFLFWIFMLLILFSVLRKPISSYFKILVPSFCMCLPIIAWSLLLTLIFPSSFQKSLTFLGIALLSNGIIYFVLIFTQKKHFLLYPELDSLQQKIVEYLVINKSGKK